MASIQYAMNMGIHRHKTHKC